MSFARADLIHNLHKSNKDSVQVSLSGETLPEEKFSVLDFVPMVVLGLTNDVWFKTLDSEQIDSVQEFLSESKQNLEQV
jgi:hypothetical protein